MMSAHEAGAEHDGEQGDPYGHVSEVQATRSPRGKGSEPRFDGGPSAFQERYQQG